MADYDNRIQIDLPETIRFIRRIWMNADEKKETFAREGNTTNVSPNHLSPGDVIVFKVVIRINDDLSWTAFRGAFHDPADAVTKHGLVLQETEAKALFSVFSKFYNYPYRFG